jgi:citrate lyase beta subunit
MLNSTHMFDAYSLGATLYMPVIHPKVETILTGEIPSPASSIVLCLEDALAENDVERGIEALKVALTKVNIPDNLRVFVRPRSLEMGYRLSNFSNITRIDGFVAPKVRAENAAAWMEIAQARGLSIMPTLETSEFFDPGRVAAVRDILNTFDHKLVAAIRLGGNDLLGTLGLRRQRGLTSWEGPLGWVLSMCSSMFISSGYPVAAPVFDIIDDLDTLKREVERDIASGFISKTAIHPAQVAIIEDAMRPSEEEVSQATAILDKDAKAVFQIGGVMCEPSTHHNWALRILTRDRIYNKSSMHSPDCRDLVVV